MGKITYADKVALNEDPSIADINKCKADDMNEIKNVVNNLLPDISSQTAPQNPVLNELWLDTDADESIAQVDDEVSTTSTNAVQNQAITNYVNGTILYNNTTGGTASEITLNDNYTNYSKIDVYYGFYDSGTSSYKYGINKSSIDLGISDLIMMSYNLNLSASAYQREYQAWRFNSTNKLTPVYQQAIYNGQDAGIGGTKIAKVIGYKE